MDAWLDDLSEDWVSQPRSLSSPSLSAAVSSASHNSTDLPAQSRSRIPRFRSASGSVSAKGGRDASSKQLPGKRKGVLTERTFSDDNIISPPSSTNTECKTYPLRSGARSCSASSSQSVVRHGSVGAKLSSASPSKNRRLQDTPEWKRRLIKGELGYGDQKDLFSPIGLENIFQQPSQLQKSTRRGGKRGLSFLKDLEAIPSSPPPWPPAEYQAQQDSGRNRTTRSRPDLGVVYEREEMGEPTPLTHSDALEQSQTDILEDENVSGIHHEYSRNDKSHTNGTKRGCTSVMTAGGRGRQPSTVPCRTRSSSIADPEQASVNASRTVSGQTELRNEEFSPVYVSKHNTADGRIDYAAIDLSKSQLVDRLRSLTINSEADQSSINDSKHMDNVDDSSYARLRSETLPDDLPVGTPDVVNLGEFVSVKRGGYSADGSFQQRPLSPFLRSQLNSNSVTETSTPKPAKLQQHASNDSESGANTEIVHHISSPASLLKTPTQAPNRELLSPDRTRSSGSPLKLFGNHDTFTSNKLYRRMSQLEGVTVLKPSDNSPRFERNPSIKRTAEVRLTSVEEAGVNLVERHSTRVESPVRTTERRTSRGSSFGVGQLDEYSFPEDFSLASPLGQETPESVRSHSPSPNARPPGSQIPFRFRVASMAEVQDTFHGKRKPSNPSAKSSLSITKRGAAAHQRSPHPTAKSAVIAGEPSGPPADEIKASQPEGKRPAGSPCKHPTPKRRRTLVRVEVEGGTEIVVNSVRETTQKMHSAIEQKRNNARQISNVADPDVLARRHILRPRNPTPSQRRRQEIEAEILATSEASASSTPRLEAIQEHLAAAPSPESSLETAKARAVATEIAAFSAKVDKNMHDETRNRSVNTQDFLDEAMKIMSFIRNKGKPPSGLGNVEESSLEGPDDEDSSTPAQSSLIFSRSPAPVGSKIERRQDAILQEQGARVLSHLRRFEDGTDDEFIASSRSQRTGRFDSLDHDPFEGQTPNIRIRESSIDRPGRERADTSSTEKDPGSMGTNPKTHSSHTSADSSLGRTIATNTSRKSENIATLNPDAVAHLIPDHVAGMSFDREKGIWVKKHSPKKANKAPGDVSHVTQSDEDPFGNIPDLTVDEADEINRTGISPSRKTTVVFGEDAAVENSRADYADRFDEHRLQQESRPQTREGAGASADTSSVPSKSSRPTTRESQDETRATSWSEQAATLKARKTRTVPQLSQRSPGVGVEEEVEHEIQIDEGRNSIKPRKSKRNLHSVTIAFSSPVIPRMRPSRAEQLHEHEQPGTDDVSDLDLADSEDDELSQLDQSGISQCNAPQFNSRNNTSRHVYRGAAGRASRHARAVTVGSISRIDEHNELSFAEAAPEQRIMNLSVSVPVHDVQVTVPSTPGSRADVTFLLSDLPEFTVHQIDERELPERTLVKRDGAFVEDRFESGNTALVKALQDVEEEEPFWEELRQVNLRERRLTSLHMLEVFCDRVEDLDVSNNELCQLGGVPHTVRHLQAQRNALTSLTSWGHLMNLQYLDVTGNDIDSLEGFCHLVHLRELKADDNAIWSLDGILGLDGLLKLSVKGNKLREVDFGRSDLKRLTDVDLSGNEITAVRGLDQLPQLCSLNLDDNDIHVFPTESPSKPHTKLHTLKLSGNKLQTLSLRPFSHHLRRLYIDRNLSPVLTDISYLPYLTLLSVRNQTVSSTLPPASYASYLSHPDLTTLLLSGTPLPPLTLPHTLPNLQRLDLSSTGLATLPPDFGLRVPNLRSLNLNFNALKDLRPLLGIRRLRTLLLAGNRLGRLRKNAAVLARLNNLERLDLRDNPFSVGFYPPAVKRTQQCVVLANSRRERRREEEKEEEGEAVNAEEDEEWGGEFVLPPRSQERDREYLARLDEDTRLRRRVYEMLLANSCKGLKVLDGMVFERRCVLVKDEVWERLLALGVVRKSRRGEGEGVGEVCGEVGL